MKHSPEIPDDPQDLRQYLAGREADLPLKEGTEARIIWNNGASKPAKTDYAIVYLHGFRASHPEGDPVHQTVARTFGYNLYLSRLREHGMESDCPLRELTEDKLLESATHALEIGRRIGRKVILMGTSTGGSLALWLASQPKYRELLSSLILYSPLIDFYGWSAKLLTSEIARKTLSVVPGRNHLITTANTTYAEDRIWNKRYALGGALALGAFVQHQMNSRLFKQVDLPVFVGYYYKNRQSQDKVVSVKAINQMVKNLGTRTEWARSRNFPKAGNHVICSSLLSKSVENVIVHTEQFLKDIGSHAARETDA